MRTILSLFLIFTVFAEAQNWPKNFTPGSAEAKYQDLGQEAGLFRYRTKHYRIESDTALNARLLHDFAKSIESVAIVLERIPLPLTWPPEEDLPKIKICATEESFIAVGGTKNAAGYYDGRRKQVLILKDQFLPPQGDQTQLTSRPNFSILVHELVHLRMHGYLPRTKPWFYEGVAEYLAAAHGNGGRPGEFDFIKMEQKIRQRIKRHSDPSSEKTIITNLTSLIRKNSHAWHQYVSTKDHYELLEPYSGSLLLAHYFFHGGTERLAEVREYLHAAKLVQHRDDERPNLIPINQAKKIEQLLTQYWDSRGLKLLFK